MLDPPFDFGILSHFFRNRTMSQHRSFQVGGTASLKKRNVLSRFERVELLRKRGEWKAGDKVVGLKKTKPEE